MPRFLLAPAKLGTGLAGVSVTNGPRRDSILPIFEKYLLKTMCYSSRRPAESIFFADTGAGSRRTRPLFPPADHHFASAGAGIRPSPVDKINTQMTFGTLLKADPAGVPLDQGGAFFSNAMLQ